MDIQISERALKWFKDEVGIQAGDTVKFYTQIYGSSPIQKGYSLAFVKDDAPVDVGVRKEAGGIEFVVEKDDLWFFDGHNLVVDYNEARDELEFSYVKP